MNEFYRLIEEGIVKLYMPWEHDIQRERYHKNVEEFKRVYGKEPSYMFSVPGRIEVLGNHTDHQGGKVLAAAVTVDAIGAVTKKSDMQITISNDNREFAPDILDISSLAKRKEEEEKSAAMIRGVCARFKQLGYEIGGFEAHISNNVAPGSGMSSSAVFANFVGTTLNHLYNGGKIPAEVIAEVSQYAENEYYGKPCGLMDQTASAVGGLVKIDFRHKKAEIEKIDFDFREARHAICLTMLGNHKDLTDEYALIRRDMNAVAEMFGEARLADVRESLIEENVRRIRTEVGDRAYLRAAGFYDENRRVDRAALNLPRRQYDDFKQEVRESGYYSELNLQNIISNKHPEDQRANVALYHSSIVLGKTGYRIMGGGFGGCILAIVPNKDVDRYVDTMDKVIDKGACLKLNIRQQGAIRVA